MTGPTLHAVVVRTKRDKTHIGQDLTCNVQALAQITLPPSALGGSPPVRVGSQEAKKGEDLVQAGSKGSDRMEEQEPDWVAWVAASRRVWEAALDTVAFRSVALWGKEQGWRAPDILSVLSSRAQGPHTPTFPEGYSPPDSRKGADHVFPEVWSRTTRRKWRRCSRENWKWW